MIILGRSFNRVYQEEASPEGAQGGGASPEVKQDDWKNDPRLDENGNPKEEQPKEEPKAEPKQEPEAKVEETQEFDFSAPVVDRVSKLIEDAGLVPQDVAKDVTANDGKVSEELAKKLAEKHGDTVASLIMDKLESFHQANVTKAQARDKAVFEQVQEAFKGVTDQDGAETWKELSTWAKENVPNEERAQINKLLQQGGLAAKYAVDDLVNRFKGSDTFTQEASLEEADATADARGLVPLSRKEYSDAFRKLELAGHVYGQSQEMAKLDRQRQMGMQRGI